MNTPPPDATSHSHHEDSHHEGVARRHEAGSHEAGGTMRPDEPADARAAGTAGVSMFSGLWTVPNLITLLRLLCLPLFLYLLFGRENRAAAAWLLGALGATDWVDGFVARRYGQVSEFGKVFDPTVDRLLFLVGVTAIVVDGSMPVWFAVVLLGREVFVGVMMVVATIVWNMERFDVTWWGKTATFLLMFAVPGFLMGNSDIAGAVGFEVAAWILGIPGLILSVWTAIAYISKVRTAVRHASNSSSTPPTDPATVPHPHPRHDVESSQHHL